MASRASGAPFSILNPRSHGSFVINKNGETLYGAKMGEGAIVLLGGLALSTGTDWGFLTRAIGSSLKHFFERIHFRCIFCL